MVFGRDDIFLICGRNCEFNEASLAEVIDEPESSRVVRAACDARLMNRSAWSEFEFQVKLRLSLDLSAGWKDDIGRAWCALCPT
jgi:hypothetical protein